MSVLVAGLFAALFAVCSCQTHVGRIVDIQLPGSLNLYTHPSGSGDTQYSLLAATNDKTPSTYDRAFVYIYPGQHIANNFTDYYRTILYNVVNWPGEISQVPDYALSFKGVAIPTGTDIDGKTYGSIYISNVDDVYFPTTVDILNPGGSPSDSAYAYSDLVWLQANIGQSWDIFTCRVLVEQGVATEAQFLWLNHPAFNDMTTSWQANVLAETACDSHIVHGVFDVLGNAYDVMYTTGVWTQKIAFFWTQNADGYWTADDVYTGVITSGRQFYDIQLIDVNLDGRLDLVTTSISATDGTVEVWEIPSDFSQAQDYVGHTIASGFAERIGSSEGRAPGVIKAFHPNVNSTGKPWLALSGGDDGRAYYLTPNSEDPDDWSYTLNTFADYGATQSVSGIEVADFDGDGVTDVFISVRTQNFVDVFSF